MIDISSFDAKRIRNKFKKEYKKSRTSNSPAFFMALQNADRLIKLSLGVKPSFFLSL